MPDLDSYSFIAPRQLPGLVDVLVLENWESVRTYFRYRQDKYNAVFGSEEDITRNFTPGLYYSDYPASSAIANRRLYRNDFSGSITDVCCSHHSRRKRVQRFDPMLLHRSSL